MSALSAHVHQIPVSLPRAAQGSLQAMAIPHPPLSLRSVQGEGVPTGLSVLSIIERSLPVRRRLLRQGDVLYVQGHRFSEVSVVNSGHLKLLARETDGRERITKFRFKGDWIGMDGLFSGYHDCDAVCMDTAEVWSFSYAQLLQACERNHLLLDALLKSAAHDLSTANEQMMTLCTLPTQARVAQFLCYWVEALRARQLRTDHITLRLSREEIGSHLGMTLESVSRSISQLDKRHLVKFIGKGRRDISIPDMAALTAFIRKAKGLSYSDNMVHHHVAMPSSVACAA